MKEFDVVTIGTALLDTFVQIREGHHHANPSAPSGVDESLPLGAKIVVPKIVQQSGGGATNAATTFARQGLKTAVLATIGPDAAGKIVIDELHHENIDTTYVVRDSARSTGQSVILIDPNAERTILTDRDAHTTIREEDLAGLHEIKARWAYMTTVCGNFSILQEVLAWADKANCKVAWNPGMKDFESSGLHRLMPFLKKIDLLILNKEEARTLLGNKNGTVHDLADELSKRGANRVIISDGSHPLVYVDKGSVKTVKPNEVKGVDQSGAGDALGSGTMAALLRGSHLADAVEFGLNNAEHVIMRIGAKTGILYRK